MTTKGLEQLIEENRQKARGFFESLPRDASEQGTVDALAKLLLDEAGAVMRIAADQFASVVMDIYTKEGKATEGRELLKKIHTVLTGGKT